MRAIPLLLLLLLPGLARAQSVLDLIRADRWPEAQAEAAAIPDPVAAKLVLFYRLLAPGMADAREIMAFIAENPDWPSLPLLARRRDEALAGATDDEARALCPRAHPVLAGALLRCAEAAAPADAPAYARAAWEAGIADPGWEARFLARWGAALTPASQQARFERLIGTNLDAARRQIPRLPEAAQPEARARLALRADDPKAAALLAALPPARLHDAVLALDRARWLRRQGDDDGALAVWRQDGAAIQAGGRLGAVWAERNILARVLLRAGNPRGAYDVAAGYTRGPSEDVLDARFLAGFIALRLLDDPPDARRQFRALAAASASVITQGRAHYWLGRAAATPAEAAAEYRRAAAYPTSFYGQLAALALDPDPASLTARLAAAHDPAPDRARLDALSMRELARAAALLAGWGDPHRAQVFLLRLDETSPDPESRTLAALLAKGLGMTDTAVLIARRAGRDGVALIDAGWPAATPLPADAGVEPALALGIIRQESNFDPLAVSPSDARGLMQLLPRTAAEVARKLGLHPSTPALTADPAFNIRLGTAYLAGLMDRFAGSTPLAVAAYNAGPSRVASWLAANGDPRAGSIAMLDWLELIPSAETRNYVQRVIENEVIYRARAGLVAAHPLAPWLR